MTRGLNSGFITIGSVAFVSQVTSLSFGVLTEEQGTILAPVAENEKQLTTYMT